MTCVIHLLTASQIKRKDTIKALVKMANKSQMIIWCILLMDIFAVSKSRERTFSLHSGRGHLSYPVWQGSWGSEREKEVSLFFKPAMILWWYANVAPKTWAPIMKNLLLFSVFLVFQNAWRRKPWLEADKFLLYHCMLTSLSDSERERAGPRSSAEASSGG